MISFERKQKVVFKTYNEEVEDRFSDALHWLSIKMEMRDIDLEMHPHAVLIGFNFFFFKN